MKWKRVEFELPALPSTRSVGLHLSDLIREIERDVYGDAERPAGEIPPGFAHGGFAWEAYCERLVRQRGGKGPFQTESLVDGIYMTEDYFDSRAKRVYDFKSTHKSTSAIGAWDSKFLGYMIQLKAHCRNRGTRKGSLVFMFVMGDWARADWAGPQGPIQVDFEFTREELDESWAWVIRKRDEWLKRGGPRPYAKPVRASSGTRRPKTDAPVFEF